MNQKIKTTVIGSYPVVFDTVGIMNSYFTQTSFSWEPYIKSAVHDMVSAGIDIVSDGQTRDPFIQLFTRKLSGCRIRTRTEIIDTIEYKDPITVADQQFVRSVIPKKTELKGVLTGPFTLMQSCVDLFYHDKQEVAFAFAHALHKEAERLQDVVDIISIDEPFFSNIMPDYAQELLKTVVSGLSCSVMLHVCGDVSKIIENLFELPVAVLSHEFKAKPLLLEVLKNYSFSQQLCLGCVRSDSIHVETVDEIRQHIDKAVHLFGEKIMYLAPDCGQRMLPREVAFQKLKNLVAAGEKMYG